jgi:arylsulfatase A-like enzyme
MPPARHLSLYADIELPEPATLFDDHTGRARPAFIQELEIDRHMNPVYDLFLEPWSGFDPSIYRANDASGFRNLARMTPPQREAWDAAFAAENEAFRADPPEGRELVRWKYQRYAKNYLRCVRGVDDSVGRLLAWLDEHDLAKNTLVVYSSDQGFYIGDHGWYDKRWMYEESLRMPLVVRWPGVVEPGTRDTHLVQNLDYAPTFLELAGVDLPDDVQGRSLAPLLRGAEPSWRDAIYYHYYEFPSIHMVARHYGVRTATHKLIRFYQFDAWELYDLEADPEELTNRYGDPAYADVTARLAERLGELRAEFGDDSAEYDMPEAWRARFRDRKER